MKYPQAIPEYPRAIAAEEAIEELKRLGTLHPFDPKKGPPLLSLPYHCGRQFEIDGSLVFMQITLTKISLTKTFWHMSCSQYIHDAAGPSAVPDKIVVKLKKLMFPPDGKCEEIPSILHPGCVRQFIKEYQC